MAYPSDFDPSHLITQSQLKSSREKLRLRLLLVFVVFIMPLTQTTYISIEIVQGILQNSGTPPAPTHRLLMHWK